MAKKSPRLAGYFFFFATFFLAGFFAVFFFATFFAAFFFFIGMSLLLDLIIHTQSVCQAPSTRSTSSAGSAVVERREKHDDESSRVVHAMRSERACDDARAIDRVRVFGACVVGG
jgi:membrane protein implicated in regulation of membrane protease activity